MTKPIYLITAEEIKVGDMVLEPTTDKWRKVNGRIHHNQWVVMIFESMEERAWHREADPLIIAR